MTQEEKKLVLFQINEIETEMDDGDFQQDFFESLSHQFIEKGFLSEKQRESLQRIYERVTS